MSKKWYLVIIALLFISCTASPDSNDNNSLSEGKISKENAGYINKASIGSTQEILSEEALPVPDADQSKIKLRNPDYEEETIALTNQSNIVLDEGAGEGSGGAAISMPYNESGLGNNRSPIESDIIELTDAQKSLIETLIEKEDPEILQRTSYSFARKVPGNSSLVIVAYSAPKVIESERVRIIVDLDNQEIISIEKHWW
ncbi:hypothetical protein HYV81_02480 [Candidatus Woesearchaeota archaeon]|nr:hypothetical protein [Candidatus Woesearchaeota archaeon]